MIFIPWGGDIMPCTPCMLTGRICPDILTLLRFVISLFIYKVLSPFKNTLSLR